MNKAPDLREKIRMEVLLTDAIVGSAQPSFEIGAHEVNDRIESLGGLSITRVARQRRGDCCSWQGWRSRSNHL